MFLISSINKEKCKIGNLILKTVLILKMNDKSLGKKIFIKNCFYLTII